MLQSLATRLTNEISAIDNTDATWVQYVKDHRKLLMDTASIVKIDANIMFTHRYRMRALLEKLEFDTGLTWIVMWLNQLNSSSDVVGLDELIVPSIDIIEGLVKDYDSYQLKISKTS